MSKPNRQEIFNVLPKSAPEAQRALLQELKDSIAEDDLGAFDKDLVKYMIDTQWELTKARKAGKPAIRIDCPELGGQKCRKTIIDIVNDDRAFLVDSVAAKINDNDLLIDLLLHPIVGAQHKGGQITAIAHKSADGFKRQSHMHIHIGQVLTEDARKELERGLRETLDDVIYANRDWPQMLEQLKIAREELEKSNAKAPQKEIAQYAEFLNYLYNNNFTLLGYREYQFSEGKDGVKSKTVAGKSLGILHDEIKPAYINDHEEGLPRNLQELRRQLPPVSISKTNRVSTVHRRVPMDAIAIKTYDSKGNITGEKLFLGLFTSVTYSRSVSDVPYLREKVEEVVAMSDFLPGSHNRKALRHILEKYPRDELFQTPAKDLYQTALDILRLQERQRIALFTRQDVFGRYISCLVYIPRDRFGTALRKKIARVLEEELKGTCTSFATTLDDSVFARVMFIIKINGKKPSPYDSGKIEKRLQQIGQTWQERLSEALANSGFNGSALAHTHKYARAFPVAYTSNYEAKHAVFDILKIEEVLKSGHLALDLYRLDTLEEGQVRLKVYNPRVPLNLSDVMPILENMGLRAISELPFEVKPGNSDVTVWIHDFLLQGPVKDVAAIENVKANFEQAFSKVWYNEVENDSLNKLVVMTGMDWQETTILRTYVRYLVQTRYPFSRAYIQNALTDYPQIGMLLVDYFKALFDPSRKKVSDPNEAKIVEAINQKLEKVTSLDQDRILRALTALIDATLRTNYFQTDAKGNPKPCLSVKLDSKKVPGLPDPKPFREIFVYSPRVEAIHLRGDKVARGGLRWSDRHEDFRTEVLGLIKAQIVKNAVIVPDGAKGGFIVKTPTKNREEFMAEGIECYKIFIRGLLDITDNLKDGKVVPPKNTVRRDSDDPYLVVAADKGTASFSDIANAISLEYGHWLGDAFASGGSVGYDHKKMGITARGGWESVKLHFRQLNHNTQEQPFDVTGVGDMGGDVFGNAMLLSRKIRLIGAFNHVHIFCDPDPDLEVSFNERERLFKEVKGWDHYDQKKLSKGGRIYLRSEKTLVLTPEIRQRFDIAQEKVTPAELMRAILKARTDLMWFGGIGTYIKSTSETHINVGDKANDAIRIDGHELRAKVVGEGANLAMTQLGRIEYAQKGGKLNTDFIDNSAGVDSSDHEVNIKILLSDIMRNPANNMDMKARNKLLEKMTEEVAAHVLQDNYQQAQAISLAEIQASETIDEQEAFIRSLERTISLNRKLEGLPTSDEVENRMRMGKGLTRPELCILTSYAKIKLTKDLLATTLPDEPDMQVWVMDYFPKELTKKYQKEIANHRLRREIIAMSMANSIVNRMGSTFAEEQTARTGLGYVELARAYTVVREVFGLQKIWDEIESMDNKMPAEVQLRAMRDIAKVAQNTIFWFLTRQGVALNMNKTIDQYRDGLKALKSNLAIVLTPDLKAKVDQYKQNAIRNGFSEKLAEEIAIIPVLAAACLIIRIAQDNKSDLLQAASVYYKIGEIFNLDWLRSRAQFAAPEHPMQEEALTGMIDQLNNIQVELVLKILKDKTLQKSKDILGTWIQNNEKQISQLWPFFNEIKNIGHVDLATLIIAEQKLRRLCGS